MTIHDWAAVVRDYLNSPESTRRESASILADLFIDAGDQETANQLISYGVHLWCFREEDAEEGYGDHDDAIDFLEQHRFIFAARAEADAFILGYTRDKSGVLWFFDRDEAIQKVQAIWADMDEWDDEYPDDEWESDWDDYDIDDDEENFFDYDDEDPHEIVLPPVDNSDES